MNRNKTAIIIAAGSGMGAATARKLAADGYHVGLLSSSGKGEALAQELGGIGVTGTNQSQADIQKLVDLVMERWAGSMCWSTPLAKTRVRRFWN